MSETKKKRIEQLGMNPSTAAHRLRKMILFHFTKKLNLNVCYRCTDAIKDIKNFSIEHKIAWLDSEDPIGLFFDLDNIAFSHLDCNISAGRRRTLRHPSKESYNRGCRCDECTRLNTKHQSERRLRRKLEYGT